MTQTSIPGSLPDRSDRNVARGQMRADLALDSLQRVVDGLGVAIEQARDLFVGPTVEVQRQHPRLEVAQRGRQASDQRAQLLGGDDLADRIVDRRPRDHLVEGRLAVGGRRRGGGERHVLVERRVLVARRRLHRGDDLAGDAQLREVAERGLAVGAVVAHGLVQADQALLDQVVRVAAGEEVRRRLEPDEAVVTADDPVIGGGIPLLGKGDEGSVLNLDLTLRLCGNPRHEQLLSGRRPASSEFAWRRTPPRAPTLSSPELLSSSGTPFGGQFPYPRPACQERIFPCKIPYISAAAAALTFSDAIRPRIGRATSSSQAFATRGRRPLPSAPSTSTRPPA